MITLYLNKFRGFEDTFIPLGDVTFLVGENSTGKTSVLTALRVLCGHAAWASGRFQVQDEILGGFSDFASNGVPWFQIGYLLHGPAAQDRYKAVLLTFTGSGSAVPRVMDVRLRANDDSVRLHHDRTDLFFQRASAAGPVDEEFREWVKLDPLASEDLEFVEADGPNLHIPMGMLNALYAHELASYREQVDARDKAVDEQHQAQGRGGRPSVPGAHPAWPEMPQPLPLDMSWTDDLEWLAPIRAKPRRSYDSVVQLYSPEGDHVPWRLRGLRDGSRLREGLRAYGKKSGLYDDVETRKFGDTEDAPFELRVRLGDRAPNVVNVGYGVSQALPVVTSILDAGRPGSWSALQQPEVHLHPRAQAALGELLFDMALSPHDKRFIVETHSDYVVDRFRYRMRRAAQKGEQSPRAQVLFFERAGDKNIVHRMPLTPDGEYPESQPDAFRAFFLEEELKNLGY